jgi:hypothetical protein
MLSGTNVTATTRRRVSVPIFAGCITPTEARGSDHDVSLADHAELRGLHSSAPQWLARVWAVLSPNNDIACRNGFEYYEVCRADTS